MVWGCVHAQSYPQRPIRMVIGLPAGGSTDVMGRIVAARLSEKLGQQVVVDNRPGASGIIGINLVGEFAARRLHADHGGGFLGHDRHAVQAAL